ncbi:MAG: hypothetical protein K2O14_06430 [Oscillospiraceae bacterium]|nr:hypothetical protein [Oscillospiraceae bacterium]
MGVTRKAVYCAGFVFITIISCIAEYNFCFNSQLTGWLAYVFILSIVAIQTLAAGKIVKMLMPAFFERHSGKIYAIMPIVSAAALCAMLMYNLAVSADNNTQAIRGAIVFNLIPFVMAAFCIIIFQITRLMVKRHNKA